MNIVHIADVLAVGGLETNIATVLNGLSERGHNASLISQYVSVEMYNALNTSVNVLNEKLDYSIYEKYILDNNIQVIHVHPYEALSIGVTLAENFNLPVVSTYHGLWGWNRTIHNKFNSMIAVSQEVKDLLVKNTELINKIVIIQNGIDINKFYKKDMPESKSTILFIGRLDLDKVYSIKHIINAVKDLDVNLLIAGSGGEFDNLKKIVPDWVTLLGHVEDMNEVINQASIVIGTGRGIRESMLCGKVCISMDACWYDGVVNKDTIEYIEYCNFSGRSKTRVPISPDVILRDISSLLLNDNLRQDIGMWSREYALKYYTSDGFIDRHIELYEKLLKG